MKTVVFVLALFAEFASSLHSVKAKGRFLCKGKPLVDKEVLIIDRKTIYTIPDDILAESRTDSEGYVEIAGVGGKFLVLDFGDLEVTQTQSVKRGSQFLFDLLRGC
ncbi:unnamed protein product [Caenorhabditis bovis]|uniref:Uncharacterized protein n=1 Tax=Caenorhabditis bovis TaxID=2654633 RepID=A0A8S1EAC6_9PELO|nr:unnamed protein product [Caenorhabditis bovis]